MIQNWLKIAFKNYKKNWVATFINIFGLTLGLTGFMLILLHWNDEVSYESWVPDKDRTFLVENEMGAGWGVWSNSSYPQMIIPSKEIEDIEAYTMVNPYGYENKLTSGKKSSIAKEIAAFGDFFEIFPYKKIAGDFNEIFKSENAIALSEQNAKELFGDRYKNSIGKTVKHESKTYIIAAIFQKPKTNTAIQPGYIIKDPYAEENKDQWGNYNGVGFFKLKKGANIEFVNEKLNEIQFKYRVEIPAQKKGVSVEEFLGEDTDGNKVYLTRIDKMRLEAKGEGIEKGDKKNLIILMVLSILVVVLSAINFINLKTAQASQRAKEVGVRKALGSFKFGLVKQFLLETFLLCFVAYVFSLALTEFFLPSFNKFLLKKMELNQSQVFLYSGGMLLIVVLISGLIPAFYMANFKPIQTLKGNFARSKNGTWLRNVILTLQLIISSFFITAGGIVYNQVNYMMDKDLGFNGDQRILVFFQQQDKHPDQKYKRLKNLIQQIKGVEDVTYSKQVIGMGSSGSSNVDYGDKSIMGQHGSIDLNYFDFYDIPIVAGRNFDTKLSSDTITSAIVNEAFTRNMGWATKDAVGKEVKPGFTRKKYKIVGVVKDFNQWSVAEEVMSSIYFNYDRNWNKNQVNNLQIKLAENDIPATLKRIQQFWETKAEPNQAFEYRFIDKQFARTFSKYKKQRSLFTILNSIVLVVALLGLFALSALLIEQKLKTVAIKKTLGASNKTVVLGLTKQFLLITSIAVLISFPISYYFMNEWLKDFSYRIEMPWLPYLTSLVLLLALTFIVVSFKAYRATQISLVKYLKYE